MRLSLAQKPKTGLHCASYNEDSVFNATVWRRSSPSTMAPGKNVVRSSVSQSTRSYRRVYCCDLAGLPLVEIGDRTVRVDCRVDLHPHLKTISIPSWTVPLYDLRAQGECPQ